jgi:hypothetical protein
VVGVDEREQCLGRGSRVAGGLVSHHAGQALAHTVVGRLDLGHVTVVQWVRVLAVPGGEAAGLDDGHLDAELGDLAGECLVQTLESPLRGVVGAAERHRDGSGH